MHSVCFSFLYPILFQKLAFHVNNVLNENLLFEGNLYFRVIDI